MFSFPQTLTQNTVHCQAITVTNSTISEIYLGNDEHYIAQPSTWFKQILYIHRNRRRWALLWWQIFSGVWSVFKIAQADDYCETFLPVIEIHFLYYNIDNSGNKYLGWDMMGAAIFGVVQNLANSLGCILSEIFALPRQGGRERPNFGFPQILNCISWCRPNSHSQLARHLPSFSSIKYEQIIWC